MNMRERERERERERDSEQGDMRHRVENRCFRTLILKLVNPLEDRLTIHI